MRFRPGNPAKPSRKLLGFNSFATVTRTSRPGRSPHLNSEKVIPPREASGPSQAAETKQKGEFLGSGQPTHESPKLRVAQETHRYHLRRTLHSKNRGVLYTPQRS